MFDIMAYLGGAMNIRELRLNFIPGVEPMDYENSRFLQIKSTVASHIDTIKNKVKEFKDSDINSILFFKRNSRN